MKRASLYVIVAGAVLVAVAVPCILISLLTVDVPEPTTKLGVMAIPFGLFGFILTIVGAALLVVSSRRRS